MLSTSARRVAPILVLLCLSALIPVVGYRLDILSSGGAQVLAWIVKAVFPLQIFPILYFFLKWLGIEGFWFPYAIYSIIVGIIASKAIEQQVQLFSKKGVAIFLCFCASLYFVNEVIFYYQGARVFHALPPQPIVP